MFKLLRYFTITSLIAFIVVAASLGLYYRRSAVDDLVAIGESRNVSLTQAFSNSIWPDYSDFLTAVPSDFDSQELSNAPTIQALRQEILRVMQDTTVVKVKIYNLDGMTLFSTEAAQIGEDKSANAGFLTARNGGVISELTHRDTFSAFESEIEDRDVLASYIPIRSSPDASVEGVFELYTDVTPLLVQIETTQRNVILAVALMMSALYIILFFIIRRADTILREQYQERQVAAENLRLAKESAESANRAKTEFISSVSHELKSPMTAVDGYLSLVSSGRVGDLNERQASFIETARDNLDRMNRLVSDLSDISLIETNHVRLDLKPLDVLETVKETAAVFQNQIDSKQQQLNIEAQKELPLVQADRLRLVQILSNLIGNANKYTPAGGSITIGLAPVQNGKGQAVQFSIKDTGIGISDEEKEQVFQKFFRSANQEAANIPGTGLGLNLTRQLVNLHQGQIWFESELRKGSTFYFNIPAV
jgi:signal transduction histidine kinase